MRFRHDRRIPNTAIVTTLIAACLLLAGCAKTPVQAPVPGSINTADAWAFRVIADSSAAIHSVKIWEQCSVANFPTTMVVDGSTELCDPKAGQFPMQYKPQLNLAIQALNTASAAGKAYHSGASGDTTGLTNAVTALTTAITQLMSGLGSY